ncbi:MAG: M3 family metallopeptidase, partial [Myxococcota bacterium]|nr:M3 family metallopeptidase [Myxococcota bacterium]
MNDTSWWQSVGNLAARVEPLLDAARSLKADVVAAQDALEALRGLDALERLLDHPRAVAALLARVHPRDDVRSAALGVHRALVAFVGALMRDADVYGVLSEADTGSLSPEALELRHRLLTACRDAGAERSVPERERAVELQRTIGRTGTLYRRILAGSVPVLTVESDRALAGLGAGWLETHATRDRGAWSVRLTGGVGTDVLRRCEHEETRRRCWELMNTRGWPDNQPVLSQLLAAREAYAECLGRSSWAELESSLTMAEDVVEVEAFFRRTEAAARAAMERETGRLLRGDEADSVAP